MEGLIEGSASSMLRMSCGAASPMREMLRRACARQFIRWAPANASHLPSKCIH